MKNQNRLDLKTFPCFHFFLIIIIFVLNGIAFADNVENDSMPMKSFLSHSLSSHKAFYTSNTNSKIVHAWLGKLLIINYLRADNFNKYSLKYYVYINLCTLSQSFYAKTLA